jgi:uncharacterized protein (TIGR04255 family)
MNWEPAHADHSIDSVSVVIALASPLDSDTFDEVIVAGRKAAAAHHFAHRVETMDLMNMQAGQELIFSAQSGTQPPRRVAFQRLSDGAPIGEFSIGKSSFILSYSRYTSWTDFKNMGFDLLNAVQAVAPILSGVRSIQLQYNDRFTSVSVGADVFEVVSRTSSLLAPVLADKTRALHCHSGWFEYFGADRRRLTNVNIGLVDNSAPSQVDAKSTLTLLTMARVEELAGPVKQPLDELTSLHDYLKVVFKDTITTEAAARVAL